MSTVTDTFVTSVAQLCEGVRVVANDPADQIQLLSQLAQYQPSVPTVSGNLGTATANLATAVGNVCRRAALVSLAKACAAYQPTSADDARTLSVNVSALFDAEIQVAADAGDTDAYTGLKALRAGVADDLAARGATLPVLTTVQTGAPMPALALAQKLYGDATRAVDLILRAQPAHPGFLPTSFKALAS
jgi:prophage DNA circulation protein